MQFNIFGVLEAQTLYNQALRYYNKALVDIGLTIDALLPDDLKTDDPINEHTHWYNYSDSGEHVYIHLCQCTSVAEYAPFGPILIRIGHGSDTRYCIEVNNYTAIEQLVEVIISILRNGVIPESEILEKRILTESAMKDYYRFSTNPDIDGQFD